LLVVGFGTKDRVGKPFFIIFCYSIELEEKLFNIIHHYAFGDGF
jgi:hypothetical protein